MRTLRWLAVAVLCSLVLPACGQKDEEGASIEIKSEDGKTVVSGTTEEYTVKNEDGSEAHGQVGKASDAVHMTKTDGDAKYEVQTGDAAKLPDNFPKDVPMMDNLRYTMVSTTGEDLFSVTATSPGGVDDISTWYAEKAKSNGWEETVVMKEAGPPVTHVLNYSKDDRQLSIMVTTGEGTGFSTLTVMVAS